jgi:hypothetical protein
MAIQDGALRTEAEKGTNVGDYDPAMRTEAQKDGGAPPARTYRVFITSSITGILMGVASFIKSISL